jgi:hypothetical protein
MATPAGAMFLPFMLAFFFSLAQVNKWFLVSAVGTWLSNFDPSLFKKKQIK